MPSNIVVIGAGPGGLAAAMLLANAGARVTVVERSARIGGRSGTLAAAGYRFDIGPTFFLYPRILEEIFSACGRDLHDEIEMIRLDPQYHVVFEQGGDIRATGELDRMRAEIARLSPRDARNLDRFMADNRAKLKVFAPVLERPFHGLSALFSADFLRALPLMRPHRTVIGDLASYFEDPRVRLAFSFQSKYLGMSPFQCPSLFTILAFLEYEYGVYHPRGGCGAVTDALARVARQMGVEIRLNEPVEEVLFRGRRATGVRTSQAVLPADAIVINADFAHAMRTLIPDRLRRRWTDARIERKKWSCSTFMLYLGIEGRYDDLAHHTVWLSQDYERNIAAIQDGHAIYRNPSFYVQNACVTDPGQAPDGHSTLYVLVPVANTAGAVDWPREAAAYREVVLDQMAKLGMGDVRERIRFEKMVAPTDWRDDMAIYRGATFNLAHSINQMLHWRPRNRFEDIDGVYLVGGGTHPGSGLPVIFQGAQISSQLVCDDLDLEKPPAPPLLAPTQVAAE